MAAPAPPLTNQPQKSRQRGWSSTAGVGLHWLCCCSNPEWSSGSSASVCAESKADMTKDILGVSVTLVCPLLPLPTRIFNGPYRHCCQLLTWAQSHRESCIKIQRSLPSDVSCKERGISASGLRGWKLSLEIVLVIFFRSWKW